MWGLRLAAGDSEAVGYVARLGEWNPEWVCSYESRKTSVSAQPGASKLKQSSRSRWHSLGLGTGISCPSTTPGRGKPGLGLMGGGGYNKCRGLEVEAVGEQATLARWSLRGVPSKEKKNG